MRRATKTEIQLDLEGGGGGLGDIPPKNIPKMLREALAQG